MTLDLEAIEARWTQDMHGANYSAATEDVDRAQVLDLIAEVRNLRGALELLAKAAEWHLVQIERHFGHLSAEYEDLLRTGDPETSVIEHARSLLRETP